jgi:hypothetical protein
MARLLHANMGSSANGEVGSSTNHQKFEVSNAPTVILANEAPRNRITGERQKRRRGEAERLWVRPVPAGIPATVAAGRPMRVP